MKTNPLTRKPASQWLAALIMLAVLSAACAGSFPLPAVPTTGIDTQPTETARVVPNQTATATKRPSSSPEPPTPTALPPTPTDAPTSDLPSVSLLAPADKAIVRGLVQVTASAGKNASHVAFYVDGKLKYDDPTDPYTFNWDAFHERLGTQASGGHVLRAVAYTAAGGSAESQATVWTVAAAAGDCNSDGRVDPLDVVSIDAEANDSDGTNTEDTPAGAFAGNPACDANQDNRVDSADTDCVRLIISLGPKACLDMDDPLVVPLIFVPKDLAKSLDQEMIDFVVNKIEETRRFYARANHGQTFRALPLEVVYAPKNHTGYWVDGKNYELGVLQELQSMGYPVDVDWAKTPSNRLTWVMAMGSGGWAGGRHYPTGSGFSMWGDALLFAAIDLNCSRVVDGIAGQGVEKNCRTQWLPNGQIYGFGVGGAIHELGHGFGLPHPPDGDPAWNLSVMGYHWNYPDWAAPANGLADADRAFLAGSHFFPGFMDTTLPTAVITSPLNGASVDGTVTIELRGSDQDGVSSMQLLIDGAIMTLPPLQATGEELFTTYDWNTSHLPGGTHRIELRVTDTAGNVQSTWVDVDS